MSEKPTTEAPSVVQSAVAAVARLIPGADPSKNKNKKKKAKSGSGSITPAASAAPVTTAESTPTAKVAEAPAKEDLPSDLVADKKEIEKELKEDADKEQAQGVKARSAAEELVYKRIKLISKKISRMASYKDKEASLLNADQTAALKTLPGLEGAQKELEDILKGLENIERDAASKRRAQEDGHTQAIESSKSEAVESYKQSTLPLIASLISIHASLHPQDPSSNFIPPQLPAHLQDVSIEDVRTVDGLYEKLKEGENVDAVVEEIKQKEGSSAYHLIIKGESAPSASAGNAKPSPGSFETEDFSAEAAGEAAGLTAPITDKLAPEPTAAQSMAAFEQAPEAAESAPKSISDATAPTTMSFLQSSELEEPAKEFTGEIKEVKPEQQIDGPALGLGAPVPAQTTSDIPSSENAVFEQPSGAIDWADDDEHTSEADINALRKQFGMPVEAIPEVIAVAPSMPVIDPSARPAGLPPIPAHARNNGPGRGRGGIRGPAGASGNWRKASGPGQEGSEQQGPPQPPQGPPHRGGRGGFPPHGPPHNQGPPGEDDGFQSVSRRRGGPPPPGPPGAGGRGGGFGGRGRGGPDRGRGGGQGFRGPRGGAPGGEARPPQAPRQPSATAA